jgi:hypothetical protein
MQKQKIILSIIIIIVLAIIALAGFFAYKYFTKTQTLITNVQNSSNETAGWKTYTNNDWGIEFVYPSNFGVPKLDEKYGLSFSNKSTFIRRTTLQDITKYLEEEKKCIQEGNGLCYEGDLRKDGWMAVKNVLENSNSNGKTNCVLSSDCEYCEIQEIGKIKILAEHQCMAPGGRRDDNYFYGNNAIFHFDFGTEEQAIISTFKFTK